MVALKLRLESFLAELPTVAIAEMLAIRIACNASDIQDMLDTYVNEARVSFDLIHSDIRPEQRVLEVGAGLCLLSLFLRREGYQVVALEPALGGFELFEQAKQAVQEHFAEISLQVLECPAQQLDASIHGEFDLIFSNNVMEHIPDWQEAIRAMHGVLAEGGCMLHNCPNYSVPYEPHYGVPVLRHLPGLSRRLLLPADADLGVWNSLNFITCGQLRSFCSRNGLQSTFTKGLLYQALKRVGDDPMFRQRHQGLVAGIATLLLRSGLAKLFAFIPACMATPMIVRIEKSTVVSS